MTVQWRKLAYSTDVVNNSLLTANSVCVAITNGIPAPISMTASTILARLASGDIVAASVANILTLLNVEAAADVTDATNVAAAGAVMESDFTKAGDLVVGSGSGTATVLKTAGGNADVGKFLKVGALDVLEWAAVSAGAGDFMKDGSVAMTGNLDFDNKQGVDLIIQTVANEAAVAGYADPKVGKILFATSELTLHICTVQA